MIVKNKTNNFQTMVLRDGSAITVRPYRTEVVDENLLNIDLSDDIWEVMVEKKAKVVESTPRGK